MAKLIMNRREFADMLGVSPRQVGKWIERGMPAGDEVWFLQRQGMARQIDADKAVRWLRYNVCDMYGRKRLKRDALSTRGRKLQSPALN